MFMIYCSIFVSKTKRGSNAEDIHCARKRHGGVERTGLTKLPRPPSGLVTLPADVRAELGVCGHRRAPEAAAGTSSVRHGGDPQAHESDGAN